MENCGILFNEVSENLSRGSNSLSDILENLKTGLSEQIKREEGSISEDEANERVQQIIENGVYQSTPNASVELVSIYEAGIKIYRDQHRIIYNTQLELDSCYIDKPIREYLESLSWINISDTNKEVCFRAAEHVYETFKDRSSYSLAQIKDDVIEYLNTFQVDPSGTILTHITTAVVNELKRNSQ